MNKKTIVFFPIEIGIAHISRSLAVAEALQARGHKVVFALPKRKQAVFRRSPVHFVEVKNFLPKDSLMNVSKLVDGTFLPPFVKEEVLLLKKYRADCAVVDFRLSALVSAKALGIPIVNITGSGGLPFGCYFPNPNMNPLVYNLVTPVAQRLIWMAKKKVAATLLRSLKSYGKIVSVDDFFRRMHYIVPETPDYLPVLSKKLTISYVGPLGWAGFQTMHEFFPPSKKKTVYLSFGGTGFDRKKLLALSVALLKSGYRVIVSSSTIAQPEDFPSDPHLYVKRFMDGKAASQVSDLVVCHGGYGTVTDAIQAGKPVVVIPFNPDQLLHVFRLQELGMARSTLGFSPSFLVDILRMNWSRFQNMGSGVSIEQVLREVKKVFADYRLFNAAIQKHGYMFTEKNSSAKAADAVEKVLKDN